jgi:VanZ family protein
LNDLPIDQEPMTNFDKLVHLLMFLGLSGAVFFDHTRYLRRQIKSVSLLLGSFLFPVVFSGLIEIMQEYLTSYRSGDWEDFLSDGIGTFVGLTICFIINRKLKVN